PNRCLGRPAEFSRFRLDGGLLIDVYWLQGAAQVIRWSARARHNARVGGRVTTHWGQRQYGGRWRKVALPAEGGTPCGRWRKCISPCHLAPLYEAGYFFPAAPPG